MDPHNDFDKHDRSRTLRTLAEETEATIDAIVTQFSGIGSDVDVMRAEVRDLIEDKFHAVAAAVRQEQQDALKEIDFGALAARLSVYLEGTTEYTNKIVSEKPITPLYEVLAALERLALLRREFTENNT